MVNLTKFADEVAGQTAPPIIKFRAMSLEGTMVFFDAFNFNSELINTIDKKTLSQFIGHEDAYHNDIYGGDIVRVWNPHAGTYDVGVVIWDAPTARYLVAIPYQLLTAYREFDSDYCGFIIIGNIYQHRNLIEGIKWTPR